MFDSQWMLANTRGMHQYVSLLIQTYAYIAFCSYAFIDFHPWSYILNGQTSRRKSTDIFSIIVHVFCIFFLKNMPSIWANFNHVFEVFQASIPKRCAGMRLADGGIQRLSSTPHFCLFFYLSACGKLERLYFSRLPWTTWLMWTFGFLWVHTFFIASAAYAWILRWTFGFLCNFS